IELGVVGAVALVAMWLAHLALFRDGTLIAWFGLLVVTYNVVSSLFNSHLFDFGEGWLYVFGVGLTGGMMLRPAGPQAKAAGKGRGKDMSVPKTSCREICWCPSRWPRRVITILGGRAFLRRSPTSRSSARLRAKP